ncbi:MAG TPA: hypothetical protein VFR57_01600 [Burkholderiales bacterium]|jgi:hypothetical protein|nr:hypothetical protein [Burkholderiales bacterium]HSA71054.1 hypothetical protein [Burkholderiales bacterium]
MGIIQRFIGVLLGLLFVAAVLVFASLALGVLVAVGLVVWGWLWWRTRSLRRAPGRGVVIEGEYRDITPAQRIENRERP